MIRVGTFNAQNLFDRVKVLNLESTAETSKRLRQVEKLRKELLKSTYDAPVIEALLVELAPYIEVRVDRGRFFKGQSKKKISATGKNDWDGGIDFKRERFDDRQRYNTAALIEQLRADVLCLLEVEGRQSMSDFAIEYFPPKTRLGRNMLIDSHIDPRGIDVGLQWRSAELGLIRSNVYDTFTVAGKRRDVWSRDCLEVELQCKDRPIHLLCNHFKSKMNGDPPDSQEKRTAQAKRVREILLSRYDLKKDFVIVLGDLNDTPDSKTLKPLIETPNLHDVFDVVNRPADDRWTYFYKGNPVAKRRTQIDYIFVSQALKSKVKAVDVWRTGMTAVAEGEIPEIAPLEGITGWKNAASDHAAITVDLDDIELPDA